MRAYLKHMKHITSLMAFIAALLVSMSFATVSNAVVAPDGLVISNPAPMNAVMVPVTSVAVTTAVPPAGVKAVNSDVNPGFGVRPFGFGVRPFGFGLNPFGFGVRPFGFGLNPFGFGFNPFFGAGVDFD